MVGKLLPLPAGEGHPANQRFTIRMKKARLLNGSGPQVKGICLIHLFIFHLGHLQFCKHNQYQDLRGKSIPNIGEIQVICIPSSF